MLALLAAAAFAADPVFHAGQGSEALSWVGQIAGRADEDLVPVDLSAAFTAPLTFLGGPPPLACAGPPVELLALWDTVNNKVEPRVVRQDFEEAAGHLDAALASLTCLAAPAERSLGAQLHFLRGLSAFAMGQPAVAEAHFNRVLDYDSAFAYPARHSDEAKPLFTALASRRRPTGTLAISPELLERGPVTIDGNLYGAGLIELPEGPHLVQIGSRPATSVLLTVPAGRAVALVGGAAALLDAIDRPEGATALSLYARQSLGEGATVYAFGQQAVWLGPEAWRRLGTVDALLDARAAKAARLRAVGLTATTLGSAAALGGLGLSLLRRDDTADASADGYYEALGAAKANRAWALGGAGLALGGAVVFGLGVSIDPAGAAVIRGRF